eukprot:PhF_6_TR25294/c0_g1_i2/m.34908/K06943/NOG1; nucleolar GTP-binding protein
MDSHLGMYNFKRITVVPNAADFVDIILSKTQRKTPTVIHKGYEISRIRRFYIRKVKYTQKSIHDRLSKLLEDFPRIEDVHPFYGDLMNVLYDKDHYKVALGQISAVRHIVDTIGRDYVRLLKYGDSLYRCKQVKRAALGRMATVLRKLGPTLSYLEQVRQHLSRLPSIDPNTRTLLICGFPNVGKSSFLNKVSRADVEVQPYAFTTKSLYVGHTEYNYMPWQVIDTPGILDHSLDQRNVIEMQSITALAHLQATVMYFMDLSGNCGHTVPQQVSLFYNILPLFAGKPLVVVFNKNDLCRISDLSAKERELVEKMLSDAGPSTRHIETSTLMDHAIGDLKVMACELLLQQRLGEKDQKAATEEIRNRIYCAMPQRRDDIERPAFLPHSVMDEFDSGLKTDRMKTEKDWEEELGGPGVYFPKLSKHYLLEDEEWKDDVVPEIIDGMNIHDYVDPDIEQRLVELEMEEEGRVKNEELEEQTKEKPFQFDKSTKLAVQIIKSKVAIRKMERIMNHSRNHSAPKSKQMVEAIEKQRENIGGRDVSRQGRDKRTRSQSAEVALEQERTMSNHVSTGTTRALTRANRSNDRSLSVKRGEGFKDVSQKLRAVALTRRDARAWSNDGRKGEADRSVPDMMPKHLFQGKMTMGTRRSR